MNPIEYNFPNSIDEIYFGKNTFIIIGCEKMNKIKRRIPHKNTIRILFQEIVIFLQANCGIKVDNIVFIMSLIFSGNKIPILYIASELGPKNIPIIILSILKAMMLRTEILVMNHP